MTNIAELPTKDTITLIINKKNPDKVTYVFKNRYGNKIGEHVNRHGCGVRQPEFFPGGYSAVNRALSRDRVCAVLHHSLEICGVC